MTHVEAENVAIETNINQIIGIALNVLNFSLKF